MRVALYARVSTDIQEARGSIASQLEVLRARAVHDEHELVAEFLDDGHSGARLDRPGLDRLRDEAEAGLFEAVLCLTPTAWPASTRIRSWCSKSSNATA